MKKQMAAILACGMVLGALGGCGSSGGSDSAVSPEGSPAAAENSVSIAGGEGASSTAPGEFPIVDEKITLKIMIPVQAGHTTSLNDLEMFKEYEEKTNIHVEWDEISDQAYGEKYKLVLASNNLPDAFGSWYNYENSIIYKYGQEGSIIPLEGIIEEVGVNTRKYMNEREDFRKLSTYPDGHIYALPMIDENQNIRIDAQLWTNQTFLDKLGLDHPKTIDELGDYLRAVTGQDLNGDGNKEYGLSFAVYPNKPNRITYLLGYFGVAWDEDLYMNQTMDGQGPLQFAPAMEETRKGLEYLHGWYKEGLIDSEIFTQNAQQLKAKSKTEGIGASLVFWYLDLNDGDEGMNEYRVTNMPQNAAGDAVWRRNGAMPGYQANQFFITSANQYPKETLRYIDYWMDNGENALTTRFGPQGYSWDYVEGGKWTELPNIPSGEPRTMENSTLKSPWGHGIPYWCFSDFWNQKDITAPTALERQGALNASGSYMDHATAGLPILTYDEAENGEAMTIKTDLFKYVDSQLAKFITEGVTDESWNEYLSRLEALKADRWAELYNKYYEIYNQ